MAAPLSLQTDGARIIISRGFAITDLRRVTAALYNLVNTRGYRDVVLDFSLCDFTHSPPMVGLICDCERYRALGVDFELRSPADVSLQRLFVNSNWACLLDPERFSSSGYQPRIHNPAKRFATIEEHSQVVNEVMETILANFQGFSRSHLKALEWSLNEITDNVLVHSQSTFGGIIQVTARKSRKFVEFVVGDSGIGISQSLRSSHPGITSDVDALSRAIKEGVTRDKSVGQGNGLYGTYRISVSSQGSFSIHANHATLYFAESKGMHSKAESIPFSGSLVCCGIDFTNEFLLENALKFNEKPHTPLDIVDFRYGSGESDSLTFVISSETKSVGTRPAGGPVRTKLLNLLRLEPRKRIVVDFSGLAVISSSFADEVFGKIFAEVGPLEFGSRIQFTKIDPTIRRLIDKAIMQRIASGAQS